MGARIELQGGALAPPDFDIKFLLHEKCNYIINTVAQDQDQNLFQVLEAPRDQNQVIDDYSTAKTKTILSGARPRLETSNKTKTFFQVLKAPRDQDHVIADYSTDVNAR
jgi:hypothetical protein